MSHTKGPWSAWAADDGGFEIYGSGEPDYMVLCSRNPNKDRAAEMISNARLIAAAPDLLEALKEMVHLFYGYQGLQLRAAHDAILKAEPDFVHPKNC